MASFPLFGSVQIMTLASAGLFAVRYPEHPIAAMLKRVAQRLTS